MPHLAAERRRESDITCREARRGTRPSAPQDQRYASTCIFDAVCPLQVDGRQAPTRGMILTSGIQVRYSH
jgi:hypothetical protein